MVMTNLIKYHTLGHKQPGSFKATMGLRQNIILPPLYRYIYIYIYRERERERERERKRKRVG
jgi:hypothetical protein